MPKYVVGTVEEIAPGTHKIVEVGGRSIGIYNVNGDYFAILNRCPHQAGPLCKGNTYGFLKSGGVGEYEYSRPGEIVRCPWHGWEFDVKTGQSWFDPVQVRVRKYSVVVTSGSEIVAEEEPGQPLVAAEPESEATGAVANDTMPPPAKPGTTPAEIAAATAQAGTVSETEPGMEGMLKGPYVAETFPVTVDKDYVVVEMGR